MGAGSWNNAFSLIFLYAEHEVRMCSTEVYISYSLGVVETRLSRPPTCYRAKFGRHRSNHTGVGRGPKNFVNAGVPPLRVGAELTHRNTLLPPRYHAKVGCSRSMLSAHAKICGG